MIISSKANPVIKKISSLSEKKFRRLYGEFIVEGVKLVNECRLSGMEITQLVCSESLAADYPDALIVTEELFSRISTEKSPQGVLACVKIPSNVAKKPTGSCLLLDRLQDPGNLGTIIRTANAAGYNEVYLVNCTDPYSPRAVRASMGGIFYIGVYECSLAEVLDLFEGIDLVCADMDGENVFTFIPERNFCLCIGNEGNGLSEEVRNISKYKVKIPMRRTCESLNAAISAAIAMYAMKNNQIGE